MVLVTSVRSGFNCSTAVAVVVYYGKLLQTAAVTVNGSSTISACLVSPVGLIVACTGGSAVCQ